MITIVLILQQHSKFHTITFLWHEVFSFNCPPTPKKIKYINAWYSDRVK
jgi:hypothetical protein